MNELNKPNKTKHQLHLLFLIGIGLIVISCSMLPSEAKGKLSSESFQVGTQNRGTQTGKQETGQERRNPVIYTGMKQYTDGKTKVQQSTNKQQSISLGKVSTSGTIVYVKGFPEDSQATKIATYAYKISGGDIDFVALLKGENGSFNMYTKSHIIGANGYYDYGLCQINQGYHPEIVNTKEFRSDWKYQIDNCYRLYKGGTKFYAKPLIPKLRSFILVTK